MRPPTPDRDDRRASARTANERLKAGSGARRHWSLVASVLVHAAFVLGWPELQVPTLSNEGGLGGTGIQLVSLGSVPAPEPLGARPRPALADVDDPLPEPGAPSATGDQPDAGAPPPGWEQRDADLWRLAALEPDLAQASLPELTEGEDSSGPADEAASAGADSAGVRIRSETSELEYQRLTEEELMSLERLSALRPELVLMSPSNWLVVRNPDEVGRFMRARFADYGMEAGPRGQLSVSLWVDERGSVEWAEINQSSGHPQLDASALELFQNVVAFRPARDDGLRVPVAAIFWLMW